MIFRFAIHILMYVKKLLLCIAFPGLLLTIHACDRSPEQEPATVQERGLNTTSTRLAVIPEGTDVVWIAFSAQGRSVVYAVKRKNGMYAVVFQGREGKAYDHVQDIVLSPDGLRVAYAGREGDKEYCIVDGKDSRPYQDVANPVFSPDSAGVAYEAKRNNTWYIAVGKRESAGADMHDMPPLFSADGRWLTYIEQHYKEKKSVRVVSSADMKTRKAGEQYDWISATAISPDHGQIAHWAERGGRKFLVVSDVAHPDAVKEGPEYDEVLTPPVFSPDGKKLAYLARMKGKKFLVFGDSKREYKAIDIRFPPVFSASGSQIAYRAERGKKQFVVQDGRNGPSFDEVAYPVLSKDGARIAYAAKQGKSWHVIVNGKNGPAFDIVVTPQFSADGSRVVYRARKDGKRFVVVADLSGKTVRKHPAYEMVWQPVFTPDGKNIAYGIKSGQELWWKVEPLDAAD